MLGMKQYAKDYIASCRDRIDADTKAWKKAKPADATLETSYFNAQTMLLDHMFVHRLAGQEGKDGNPLNEVRVISNSILLNDGKLQPEKQKGWPNSAHSRIKWVPEKTVLGLKPGDKIAIKEADFAKLAKAFFAEIEKKYG
jgi:hypothetical protein